jgi:hypothetical protein
MKKRNIKHVQVFVTPSVFASWSKKTPTFLTILGRFKQIQSEQWTETVATNHSHVADLQRMLGEENVKEVPQE